MATKKELRERKMSAMIAARGGGKRSDLVEYDQLIDAISSQVGEGKNFSTFQEAYDTLAKAEGIKLPNANMLRGRAMKRVEWLSNSGKIKDKKKYMTQLGISEDELASMGERFAGGAAQEINKLDYARGKLANVRNAGMDAMGIPKVAQKFLSTILPFNNLLGEGQTKQEAEIKRETDRILTDEEKFWKGYGSNVDIESSGGLDLPLNLAGGAGGLLPDLLAGFGAGVVGKKVATQFLAEAGASIGMETAKYQMEGDKEATISNIVTDLLLNAVTMRGGSALANTLDKTKAGREVSGAMTTGDTQAAIEAMNLMADGKTKIPSLLVSDPASATSKINAPKSTQEALDIKKAFGEAEAKTATDVDDSLTGISPDVEVKKANAPIDSAEGQDPVAKQFVDEIEARKSQFIERAQPFTDAYKEVGADIDIDLNEVLQAGSRITDPTALGRFESIITGNINRINDVNKINLLDKEGVKDLSKFRSDLATDTDAMKALFKTHGISDIKELANVKGIGKVKLADFVKQQKDLTKRGELNDKLLQLEKKAKIGDRSSFSANDVDIIVKQLREEIVSNKQSMSALSETGINQLKEIRSSLKGKLQDLPKEFSEPYNKAMQIYADGFKVYGEDTMLGNVRDAVKSYKTSGSLKEVRELIGQNPMFDSLSKYSSVLSKDSDAYKGLFREGFDNKLKGVRDARGSSVFDFQMYGDALKGTNWEELMRYAPDGAEDSIKTLSGYQSMIARMERKGSDLLTNSQARNEALDKSSKLGLFNPKTWLPTAIQSGVRKLPQVRPWFNETDIGLGSNIAGKLNQLLPSGSRKYIMESAEDEGKYFTEQLNNLREAKGMSPIVEEPIIPKVYDKLTNSEFDFKE